MMSPPSCRLCGTPLTATVIDLGEQPLANSYVDPASAALELTYPLHARLCESCGLVQVDDVVAPQEIFGDYAYFSSVSDSWVDHAHGFADVAVERLGLVEQDLVVEIASNDGYLLQWFIDHDIRVLGIEPAANVAAVAIERGVPTVVKFFGEATARKVRAEQGAARLIVGNNVLAHVPDLNDFIAGLKVLLAPDGRISVEFPHLLNLVRQTQFDTIYHEHYSYFSLLAAARAFERHGLRVVEVEELPTHGGSLRLWICHSNAPIPTGGSVAKVLDAERRAELDLPSGYRDFGARAQECRDGLIRFLEEASSAGQRVVAYGAAAKGNTLLNFAGVGSEHLEYVVDRSKHKQGTLLPGSRVPVRDPAEVMLDQPDFLLVLPWNLRDEITTQMSGIREWGGRFVTAIPAIEVF